MGMKWTGADPQDLVARIRLQRNEALDGAEQITEKAVTKGAALEKQLLDRAVTPYGEQRMARGRGRSAGRNDTGSMIDDVESRTTRSKTEIKGQWGHLSTVKDYYELQMDGTSRIPAAGALVDSFLVVREEWIDDLRKMVS